MRKRIVRILAVIVLLVIVVGVVIVLSIDGIARKAVEHQATQTLGVNTTLGELKLHLMRGEIVLKGLNVANPVGFTSDHFLKMGGGDLEVAMGSLVGGAVQVPKLELSDIDVNLEKKSGKANYDAILANLKKQDSQDKNAQPGKKFTIHELTVRNVTVHADLVPLPGVGGKLTRIDLTIPEIKLKNVGTDSDKGVAMAEVTNVVMKSIFTAILQKGGDILPKDIASGLGEGLAGLKDVGKLGVEVVGNITNTAGQAVTDLTKGVGDAGKGAGDQAGKAIQGLGNLLTPGKSAPAKEGKDQGK